MRLNHNYDWHYIWISVLGCTLRKYYRSVCMCVCVCVCSGKREEGGGGAKMLKQNCSQIPLLMSGQRKLRHAIHIYGEYVVYSKRHEIPHKNCP